MAKRPETMGELMTAAHRALGDPHATGEELRSLAKSVRERGSAIARDLEHLADARGPRAAKRNGRAA